MSLDLIRETLIQERPFWTLAVNRNQALLGKTMLVLRRDATTVIGISPDEWAELRDELRRLVPALSRLFRPDQFNFAFLMNVDAQVHLHVVPRYAAPRRWHYRTFTDDHWGAAFGQEEPILPAGELRLLAEEIRGQLA